MVDNLSFSLIALKIFLVFMMSRTFYVSIGLFLFIFQPSQCFHLSSMICLPCWKIFIHYFFKYCFSTFVYKRANSRQFGPNPSCTAVLLPPGALNKPHPWATRGVTLNLPSWIGESCSRLSVLVREIPSSSLPRLVFFAPEIQLPTVLTSYVKRLVGHTFSP